MLIRANLVSNVAFLIRFVAKLRSNVAKLIKNVAKFDYGVAKYFSNVAVDVAKKVSEARILGKALKRPSLGSPLNTMIVAKFVASSKTF